MLKILQKSLKYNKILTKQQAYHRQSIIKPQSIQYSFHINLNPGNQYNGLMQMKFDFISPQTLKQQSNTTLDFQGSSISSLTINSQQLPTTLIKYCPSTGKITLPHEYLQQKQNYISIRYQSQYDMDGSGCVSFTDIDQKQYLYTQFQPYMANRVFPLFDQPDLKAKMKLALTYPQQWQTAISNQPIKQQVNQINTMERSVMQIHKKFMRPVIPEKYNIMRDKVLQKYYSSIPNTHKLTSFKQTSLLPSYLYCFVVGPYKKFTCLNTYKNIPMSLYCIQSLQPYLKTLRPFIQQMTNKSFQFFQKYFNHAYPFSKYDQVFAHEYKWGAMQNAGIVTLNDLYLFKDKVSNEKMLSFGNTIIHELAHHWFGNLVTMKWWDDLWLNQSFAEYISHYCLQKIKKNINTLDYQSAMLSFYIRKGWGYNQDQLITTHPITSPVPNTHIAQSIFDGITYSKGAAVMKQLQYLIGQQNFSKALGQYFNKFAFKNTQLDDLLNCIEKYFPQMKQWKEMWLKKAGGNLLSCQWQKNKQQILVRQTHVRDQHQTLRIHKINIAYIQSQGNIHKQQVLIKNLNEQKFTIPSGIKPQAIVLNYQDLTFSKISIDPISFKYFQQNLYKINDPLLRAMIWRTLYEMVRDSRMTTVQYLNFIINNLRTQKSDVIIEQQLGYLHICLTQYTPQVYRENLFISIYSSIKSYLLSLNEQQHPNRSTILKDKLISFTYTQQHKNQLYEWFLTNKLPKTQINSNNNNNHPLNISQKWKSILKIFTSFTIRKQSKLNIFSSQCQIDNSDTMLKRKLTCDILLQQNNENLLKTYNQLKKMQFITSTTNYVHQLFINNILNKNYKHCILMIQNQCYKSNRVILKIKQDRSI